MKSLEMIKIAQAQIEQALVGRGHNVAKHQTLPNPIHEDMAEAHISYTTGDGTKLRTYKITIELTAEE